MNVAVGVDHRGCEIGRRVGKSLQAAGHSVTFLSDMDASASDYPDAARSVGEAVGKGEVDRGVLVCGSGIGMSIAANKVQGVRAALVHDELSAEMSRAHNDANVLCLSADLLGPRLIDKIVEIWMTTPFEGGRHARRVAKIKAIEQAQAPAGERSQQAI